LAFASAPVALEQHDWALSHRRLIEGRGW